MGGLEAGQGGVGWAGEVMQGRVGVQGRGGITGRCTWAVGREACKTGEASKQAAKVWAGSR